ncbi:hypothetical protein LL037_22035 [Clostridium estertheticum]|uniref:hypothetical protein n=1 Tax=Clostridium estertheticum TaxID=238834 RepID=UPI001C0BDD6B|nr:hypothetical protein [Clostridium estertheticum]MBU3198425.1 hypothetical protein [Clostridium estertheticum]WAG65106.1 hypothetical protein LL037_22035 [Clostridium estertheticum]
MRLKKKKGSSLIAVMLIFAVLSISGLSVLALTVSDYNMRMTASKKTQSLYASDSGINVVYGIMKKVISQSIQKGNKSADDYMTAFNLYSSANIDPLKGSYAYLYSPDGSLDTKLLKAKLNDVFQESYKSYILEYITSADDYLKNGKYLDLTNNIISIPIYNASEGGNQTIITVSVNPDSFPVNLKKWKVIKIASQFFTNPLNGQTSNKKTVNADIVISIPNYKDSYFVETKKQEVSINPVWKNAISIDGDMNINSDITVNGSVFVKGTPPVVDANSDNVKTKYNGGISIGSDDTNKIEVNFNNNNGLASNVVTANSFNISGQNKTVNVYGNIYAGNVYVGNSSKAATNDASNCTLTVRDTTNVPDLENVKGMVYTDNDLSLYATKSHIDIDKYYGINDIGDIAENKRAVDKDYNSSSSIIVNTDDIGTNSSIHIGDAIINGTAYINTATPYQTGESVSIKGNYAAYTIPIPQSTGTTVDNGKYDENHVEFAYNDPLQLVNNFKDPITNLKGAGLKGVEKSEYFKRINELNLTPLNKSGVNIDNLIFSAGVALNKGEIETTAIGGQDDVISKQNDFARIVYEMGDKTHLGVPMTGSTSEMLNDDYQQGKVYKDVFGGDVKAEISNGYQTNVIAQVNSSNVGESNPGIVNNSEVEVRTSSKNVVLLGTDSTYTPDPSTDEVIDLTKKLHGIIITSKNVILSGKIDFTGTIIAGGNLTTMNDGLKTLTYDDNYVMKTIARNYTNTYSKIFNETTGISKQIVEIAASVGKNSDGTSNVIDGGLVKLANWRVNN